MEKMEFLRMEKMESEWRKNGINGENGIGMEKIELGMEKMEFMRKLEFVLVSSGLLRGFFRDPSDSFRFLQIPSD